MEGLRHLVHAEAEGFICGDPVVRCFLEMVNLMPGSSTVIHVLELTDKNGQLQPKDLSVVAVPICAMSPGISRPNPRGNVIQNTQNALWHWKYVIRVWFGIHPQSCGLYSEYGV